jgi:hypothetical protein
MQVAEALPVLNTGLDGRHAEGRTVRRENHLRWAEDVELGEDTPFEFQVLGQGFDYEVRAGYGRFQRGVDAGPGYRRFAVRRVGDFLRRPPAVFGTGPVHGKINRKQSIPSWRIALERLRPPVGARPAGDDRRPLPLVADSAN